MAENKQREGFTFYRSFRDSINLLGDNDTKLNVFQAIADFALDGIEPNAETLSNMGLLCWTAIRPNVQSDKRRWENGSKGGAPKGNKNAQKTTKKQPRNNLKTSNVNVSVNDNVTPYIESEDFLKFKKWLKDNAPRVLQMKEPFTETQYHKLKTDFDTAFICDLLCEMHNYEPLLKRNINANLTFRNWAKLRSTENRMVSASVTTKTEREWT